MCGGALDRFMAHICSLSSSYCHMLVLVSMDDSYTVWDDHGSSNDPLRKLLRHNDKGVRSCTQEYKVGFYLSQLPHLANVYGDCACGMITIVAS